MCVCVICHAVNTRSSYFMHSLIQKRVDLAVWPYGQSMYQAYTCTSSRTDTTHRSTYSMARAIRATTWQKVSSVDAAVCIVACLTHKFGLCVKLLVTLTYQWLHSLQRWGPAHVKSDGKSASSVHTTLVYMSYRGNTSNVHLTGNEQKSIYWSSELAVQRDLVAVG